MVYADTTHEKPCKIIVAHNGKQHSYQTANALNRQGYLYKYITTVYDKPWSWTWLLMFFLRGQNKKKAITRKNPNLKNNQIKQFCELLGILLLFALRIPLFFKLFPNYFQYLHDSFGEKVAYYAIKEKVDIVIMYDTDALRCFEILQAKAPHIKRILDVSISSRQFMKKTFEQDMERYHHDGFYHECLSLWDEKNMKLLLDEMNLTNFFFAPSQIVRKSLLYCNVSDENIFLIPYGVNIEQFKYIKKTNQSSDTPLRLIYVGQISYRKGIHHLLKVVSSFPAKSIELYLAGDVSVNNNFVKNYEKLANIHFLGFITRNELATLYQKCDVFVFSTLGEGYGLVVLEALSCGLPVICSDLAGGNDAIIDGCNGFVFEGGNNNILKEKIDWFIQNRDKLPAMSENARKTAINYTWEHYYAKLNTAIEQIMGK